MIKIGQTFESANRHLDPTAVVSAAPAPSTQLIAAEKHRPRQQNTISDAFTRKELVYSTEIIGK
jgi:hypothetical protein